MEDLTGQAIKNKMMSFKNKKQSEEGRPPNYLKNPPLIIAFQGGGPKGISYIGGIQSLEDQALMKHVKHCAGTSAGAITATLLAIGFTSKEMYSVLKEVPLTTFLDHPFNEKTFFSFFHSPLKSLKTAFETALKSIKGTISDPFQILKPLMKFTGLCNGDKFQEWIESEIYTKTKIHHCTFKELRELISKDTHNRFKHLHVFASKIGICPATARFSTDDPKCDNLVISYAVTASMAVPGLFKPRVLFEKNEDKQLVKREGESYLDGGMINNFPLEQFDKMGYIFPGMPEEKKENPVFNSRVLGFSLYSPQMIIEDKPITGVSDLLLGILNLYAHCEQLYLQKKPKNKDRTVSIDNLGVNLTEFDLSQDTMELMIQIGLEMTTSRLVGKKPDSSTTPLSNVARRLPASNDTWYTGELKISTYPKKAFKFVKVLHPLNFIKKMQEHYFQHLSEKDPMYKIFPNILDNPRTASLLFSERDTNIFLRGAFKTSSFVKKLLMNDQKKYVKFFADRKLLKIKHQFREIELVGQENKESDCNLLLHTIEKNLPKSFEGLLESMDADDKIEEILDDKGNTILHTVIDQGRKKFYKILKRQQKLTPLLNIKNKEGKTPLIVAIEKKSYNFVKKLFNHPDTDLTVLSSNKTLLRLLYEPQLSIFNFREKSTVETLALLLIQKWEEKNVADQMIDTDITCAQLTKDKNLLYFFAQEGQDSLVTAFCKHLTKRTFLDEPVWSITYGQTALHIAAKKNHFKVVKTLIENGADYRNTTCRIAPINAASKIPLKRESYDMISKALYGAREGVLFDQEKIDALVYCSEKTDFESAKELITKKITSSDCSNVKDAMNGEGCLSIVLKSKTFSDSQKLTLVELLLKGNFPDKVNRQDTAGKTPLHFCKNIEMAELLCSNGGDSRIKDRLSRTPRIIAIQNSELSSYFKIQEKINPLVMEKHKERWKRRINTYS